MVELSPASAGFFFFRTPYNLLSYFIIIFTFTLLTQTLTINLAPLQLGYFVRASPPACCATNVRLGVGGAGLPLSLLASGPAAGPHQTVWTNLAPLPGGAFVWAPPPSVGCPALTRGVLRALFGGPFPDKPGGREALGKSRWGLAGLCSPVLTKWLRLRPPGLRAGAPRLPAHAVGSGAVSQPTSATRPTPLGTGAGPCREIFAVRGPL